MWDKPIGRLDKGPYIRTCERYFAFIRTVKNSHTVESVRLCQALTYFEGFRAATDD